MGKLDKKKTADTDLNEAPSTAPEIPAESSKEASEARDHDAHRTSYDTNPAREDTSGDHSEAHDSDPPESSAADDEGSDVPDQTADAADDRQADVQADDHEAEPRLARLKRLIQAKKAYVYAAAGALLVVITLAALVEPLKFAALNLVTDGKAEFIVVDDTTLVPVEKAIVTIKGKTADTDKKGRATVSGVAFGPITYTVKKDNYTTISGSIKVKPGTNLAGPLKFHSEGKPFIVTTVNKLSKETLTSFTASIQGTTISALSNGKGIATLKIPSSISGEVTMIVSAKGYADSKQKVTITKDGLLQAKAELTPGIRQYFLSNRTGKVAVLSANLDGSDPVEVIPGTVSEDGGAELMLAPDGKHAVLVSRRDNQKAANGDTLPALFAIDIDAKTIKRIDEGAPAFSLLGWNTNNQIIYAVNYNDYQRADNSKLKIADVTNGRLDLLHAQKGFATFLFYDEDRSHVYFSSYDQTQELYGLISLDVKSKNKKRVFEDAPYDILHVKPYALSFKYENGWHELNMKTQDVKTSAAPSEEPLLLSLSPQGGKTAWVENRDGKGTIITGDAAGANPKQVKTATSVSGIVRWISEDYIIYTTQTNTESAQYVVHLATGTTTKISDVYVNRGGRGY